MFEIMQFVEFSKLRKLFIFSYLKRTKRYVGTSNSYKKIWTNITF